MKVRLNPAFEGMSGQLGEMVFRELRGETIISRKPALSTAVTVEQLAHRERFKQAAAYGKSALANQTTRQLYEEAAKSKNMPVFAMTVADFFNAPVIDNVDLSVYHGHEGSFITISARDDFDVVRVHVSISDDASNPIESGEAVLDSGSWVYTITEGVSAGTNVIVNVVATDRPGGTAVKTVNKSF